MCIYFVQKTSLCLVLLVSGWVGVFPQPQASANSHSQTHTNREIDKERERERKWSLQSRAVTATTEAATKNLSGYTPTAYMISFISAMPVLSSKPRNCNPLLFCFFFLLFFPLFPVIFSLYSWPVPIQNLNCLLLLWGVCKFYIPFCEWVLVLCYQLLLNFLAWNL